jgi:hypothetical protein
VVGYALGQEDDHLQTPYDKTIYASLNILSLAYQEALEMHSFKTGNFEKVWTVKTKLFF